MSDPTTPTSACYEELNSEAPKTDKMPSRSQLPIPESSSQGSSKVSNLIVQAAQIAQQEIQEKASHPPQSRNKSRKNRKSRVDFDAMDEETESKGTQSSGLDPESPGIFHSYDTDHSRNIRFGAERLLPRQESRSAYILPMPPAFALLDMGKPSKNSNKSQGWWGPVNRRFGIWLGVSLFVVFMLSVVALFTAFLILNPKQPKYSLTKVQVQWWVSWKDTSDVSTNQTLTNGTAGLPVVYVYADAIMLTEARNPNKDIEVMCTNTTLDVYYQDVLLGSAHAPAYKQSALNTVVSQAEWRCDGCPVPDIGHYLEADEGLGAVPLTIKLTVYYRAKIFGLFTPKFSQTEYYGIVVKPPSE